MSPKEFVGLMSRDYRFKFRYLTYLFAAATAIYKATPVVLAILATPANVAALVPRVDRIETKLTGDSARQARILCLQEVQLKVRPQTDLETRCVQ